MTGVNRAFGLWCAFYLLAGVRAPAASESRTDSRPAINGTPAAGQPGGQFDGGSANDALAHDLHSLQLALADLTQTYGSNYPRGQEYLARLQAIAELAQAGESSARPKLDALKQEALLANPLLQSESLMLVKRKHRPRAKTDQDKLLSYAGSPGADLGLPSNHECNSSVPRTGYDNEIAILSPIRPGGALRTLYRPSDGGYVGELDLHWDAGRFLFTEADATNWKVCELRTDGSGRRQVSQMPDDVDSFDASYLPNGKIIFGSTASYQSVPCWHGQKRVSNLYLMNGDGSGARQLCYDQDHDLHAVVLPSGQVLYHRWDYTGINHIYLRQLMAMNPDGTGQRAVYGVNSWFPNALYFPRPLPGGSGQIVCILSGYHGVHKMGQLVIVDPTKGWQEADGLVQRISGRGDPITPQVHDVLVDRDWPKFLHPFPLNDKYFLVAAWPNAKANWGIYLADVFDNLTLVREEPGSALLEPVLLKPAPKPPVIPDRVDLSRTDASVYLQDVYAGAGLQGVPRDVVKSLRVISYNFAYRGLGGPDRIGYGGPWEEMRILGTVPLEADGSAFFRVPANTPVAVQALDGEGKAVQLMRSWFTAMPGEHVSCVGCHDRPSDTPLRRPALAANQPPRDLTPWHGPARGFDFTREVQPVLDQYCVSCHDGRDQSRPDLRSINAVKDYAGRKISDLGIRRLHPQMLADTHGILRYAPAYDALIPYLRRVSIEDDVSMLQPGEYHADNSPLIQLLRKGHGGVTLDPEAWDRLVTWIDLNAPCHGTWNEVYPIPDGAHERRMQLRKQFGGPDADPETIPALARSPVTPVTPKPIAKPDPVQAAGWPCTVAEAQKRQADLGPAELNIDLGDGTTLKLVHIPAGEFVMGDADGQPDEWPLTRVVIRQPFWMGACEVNNEQYRRFDAAHDSRYYGKRHALEDDQGLPLNGGSQPVVRVSWEDASAFCHWLAHRTGRKFALPTEAQWEYACRAGSATPLGYGATNADFSAWANVADQSFSIGYVEDGKQITGGVEHLILEGAGLSDARFNDHAIVTAPVGSYRPNPWGLHDMHGNAAEWTRSAYQPYPYHEEDGRNDLKSGVRKVVRGGSFFDNPSRCRSAFRLAYPAWQHIFNVGFRVVLESGPTDVVSK